LGPACFKSGDEAALGEQGLQFAGLEHFPDDVAAADEFAFDIELGNGRPIGELLNAFAQGIAVRR
jgi:hypothetical protein